MAARASSITLESGLTLSYAEQGDSPEPVVVFLPGPTDSWRSYESVLGKLPPSLRAIAVSQRGHGDSDKPATGYRVEDFAADVPDLLDAVGIAAAVLVGHSGSCLVARRVAIDHPDRVLGLVLEASPSTLNGNPDLKRFLDSAVLVLEDPIDPTVARSFVVDTSSVGISPGMLDELTSELLKVPARVWRETFSELLRYDDLANLQHITAPTLLVWGDADGLVGREMQDDLRNRIRGATLITYRGVGHTPRWKDPSRFASDLTAFVMGLHPGSSR